MAETTQASTDIQATTSKMAEAYQGSALLTHVLAIIQNLSVDGQAKALNNESLKAALRYPWLAQRFGHTLVKYESEWYAEIDGEGKMSKWEALNEQMSSEAQSYLDFLNDQQDKEAALAKLEQNHRQLFNDTKTAEYLQKMNEFFDGLLSLKRHAQNDAKKRENLNSFKAYLANNIELWEKEKQRIKTLLWWDGVAKKLAAKQAAQTKESEAAKADQPALPSLSVDGKAWYLHPVGMALLKINALLRWSDSPFAILLGKVESNNDYSAYNRTKPKLKAFFNTDITSMTLRELIENEREHDN